jgi:hypothetical protein
MTGLAITGVSGKTALPFPNIGGAVTYRSAFDADYSYLINGFNFQRDGTTRFDYSLFTRNYIGASGDITSQIGKHHELKGGVDYKYYTIRRYNVDVNGFMKAADLYGGEQNIPESLYPEFLINTYGYDAFGNELNEGFDAAKHPEYFSGYVQDKIEYQDIIINAGLRLDWFNTRDRYLENPANVDIDEVKGIVSPDEWKDKDPITAISPRLGISFPVSDRTVFYTQYGKFVQIPQLNDLYYSQYEYGRQIGGGFFYLTPVGFDIDAIYTTTYEIGFRQQMGDYASFDIAGFYKNIKGQIQADRVVPEPEAQIQSYNIVTNGDFATTKGIELKLVLRRFYRLQAQMNYTLTVAEGTGSGSTSFISAVDRITQRPTTLSPLDFEQTHRGSINLDYRFGENEGGPILENFGANLLFNFNSGHPFTLVTTAGGQSGAYDSGVDYMNDTRSRQAIIPINSAITPWQFNMDLRLDKTFKVYDKLQATVYMRVLNLLNNKNIENIFQVTGSAEDDGWISGVISQDRFNSIKNGNGGEDYVNMYRAINLENGQAYWDILGLQLYNNPRQIFFGIKLTY